MISFHYNEYEHPTPLTLLRTGQEQREKIAFCGLWFLRMKEAEGAQAGGGSETALLNGSTDFSDLCH